MDDYIERNAAIDALRRRLGPNTSPAQKNMLQLAAIDIRGIKDADVAPVVHGRWIHREYADYSDEYYYCSECHEIALAEFGKYTYVRSDFCPNCGAKMDGGGEHA